MQKYNTNQIVMFVLSSLLHVVYHEDNAVCYSNQYGCLYCGFELFVEVLILLTVRQKQIRC